MPEDALTPGAPELVESYQRLADVFHEVLAEQSLDALLVRIADALGDLIPHDTLTIYEADESQSVLTAVFARDEYADEIMATQLGFDEGITGWAARRREPTLVNQAHLDPRVRFVPGTPKINRSLLFVVLVHYFLILIPLKGRLRSAEVRCSLIHPVQNALQFVRIACLSRLLCRRDYERNNHRETHTQLAAPSQH